MKTSWCLTCYKWGSHVKDLSFSIRDTQEAIPNRSESSRMGPRHAHFEKALQEEFMFQAGEMDGTRKCIKCGLIVLEDALVPQTNIDSLPSP